jgi:hypothetical protein
MYAKTTVYNVSLYLLHYVKRKDPSRNLKYVKIAYGKHTDGFCDIALILKLYLLSK